MSTSMKTRLCGVALVFASLLAGQSSAEVPVPAAAPGRAHAISLHAEGAQIYECKADSGDQPTWQLREPIATLLLDGKTVGRHYAGPRWEHIDGSAVLAKPVSKTPGSTANDVPWLNLAVTQRLGSGALSGVTTVQRINTSGGMAQGPCDKAGDLLSLPYRADYVFLRQVD
jgi:hypothetical protein